MVVIATRIAIIAIYCIADIATYILYINSSLIYNSLSAFQLTITTKQLKYTVKTICFKPFALSARQFESCSRKFVTRDKRKHTLKMFPKKVIGEPE